MMDWGTIVSVGGTLGVFKLLEMFSAGRRNAREFIGLKDEPKDRRIVGDEIRVKHVEEAVRLPDCKIRHEPLIQRVAELEHNRDIIWTDIKKLQADNADQKARSELNGARLVQIDGKIDLLIRETRSR